MQILLFRHEIKTTPYLVFYPSNLIEEKSGKIEISLVLWEKTEESASAILNQSTRQAVPLAVKRGLLDVNTGPDRYGYV